MNDPYEKPLAFIPKVRVVDANGKCVCSDAYYFAYPKYQCYPIRRGDEKPVPLVHCVAVAGFSDWGLPIRPEFKRVTPPHRIVPNECDIITPDGKIKLHDCTKCLLFTNRKCPHKVGYMGDVKDGQG